MISAKAAALKLLSRRNYFSAELRKKLAEKGYGEGEVEGALNYVAEHGFINDEEMTSRFIAYKKGRGYGPMAIRFQLKSKGVTSVEIPKTDEHSSILDFLNRRYPEWKSGDLKLRRKIFSALQRRGFSTDAILKIFAIASNFDDCL